MNLDEAKALARINLARFLENPGKFADRDAEIRYQVEYIVAPFIREIERLSGGLDWSNRAMDSIVEALKERRVATETTRCMTGELTMPENLMLDTERRTEERLIRQIHRDGRATLALKGPLWQQEGASNPEASWVGRDTARWRAGQPFTTGVWLCRIWAVTIPRLDADYERLERG